MSRQPLIQLKGIKKTYRMGDVEVAALRGVDLTIDHGEFVSIMGPSGSGKSTLMNTLGCLDKPTAGQYLLAGRDVAKLDHDELADIRNKLLGFVFQSFHLLPRTSARENVELPLLYAGVGSKERNRRAMLALERVGLAARYDHHPNQLSGGQQQRVAIARALVSEPQLLVADEPTGNLDSRTSIAIMALFQELSQSGITIVLVTHEPDIAEYTSRRVVIKDGRIQEDITHAPIKAIVPPAEDEPGTTSSEEQGT